MAEAAEKPKKVKKPKLHTGDAIILDNGSLGWLRYKGPVCGLPKGAWYGIEYELPIGKHDGRFQGAMRCCDAVCRVPCAVCGARCAVCGVWCVRRGRVVVSAAL